MSRDLFIQLTASFAGAVSVPVNADGEKGYGDEEGVKETVRSLVAAGVAGMDVDDSLVQRGSGFVVENEKARKIKTVIEIKPGLGDGVFLKPPRDSFPNM